MIWSRLFIHRGGRSDVREQFPHAYLAVLPPPGASRVSKVESMRHLLGFSMILLMRVGSSVVGWRSSRSPQRGLRRWGG